MVLLAESLKHVPPALNSLVEYVDDALMVGCAVEFLIDGVQHYIVFGRAGMLGGLIQPAYVFLVESKCHNYIDMVSP